MSLNSLLLLFTPLNSFHCNFTPIQPKNTFHGLPFLIAAGIRAAALEL